MQVVDYTEKSIAVLGDTKSYRTELKELGGKYNANLAAGKKGWIFSKTRRASVERFVQEKNALIQEVPIVKVFYPVDPTTGNKGNKPKFYTAIVSKTMSADSDVMSVVDYSNWSVAVIGNTFPHKESLQALGGKYNANLKVGKGWVFKKELKPQLEEFVADCNTANTQTE